MFSREDLRSNTRRLALCGMLCALAAVCLIAGGLLSVTLYCGPVAAMFLLTPVREEYGSRFALVVYGAVFLLALLLSPNPEAAWVYLAWGWYPAAQPCLHRIRWRPLRCLVIGGSGALSTAVVYAVLLYVFQLEALVDEFHDYTRTLTAFLLLMAAFLFLLLDRLLHQLARRWRSSHLRKRWLHP